MRDSATCTFFHVLTPLHTHTHTHTHTHAYTHTCTHTHVYPAYSQLGLGIGHVSSPNSQPDRLTSPESTFVLNRISASLKNLFENP